MSEYIEIKFQEGPIKEKGVNGCQMEEVIDILINRLSDFQKGDFACSENNMALKKLKEVLHMFELRTNRRSTAGVEGYNKTMKGEVGHKDVG